MSAAKLCAVCAARRTEIADLEQRIDMLRGLVDECAALSTGDDYWTPEPASNKAVAEWWQQQPESGAVTR